LEKEILGAAIRETRSILTVVKTEAAQTRFSNFIVPDFAFIFESVWKHVHSISEFIDSIEESRFGSAFFSSECLWHEETLVSIFSS
jgi:hypothetical protein